MHQPPSIKSAIARIKRLVGVTQSDFKRLYVTCIEHGLKQTDSADLTQVIVALKRRQAYLLPLGADSEVVFRQREEWTYAVFTAALLQLGDSKTRLAQAKVILPSVGYAWLQRNTVLFDTWQKFLRGSTTTVLSEIITPQVDRAEDEEPVVISQPIKEVDLAHLQTAEPVVAESPANKTEQTFTCHAQDFWQWIKSGLVDKTLSVNTPESFIHGVKSGIFIVLQPAIIAFLTEQATEKQLELERLIDNERINLYRMLKRHDLLLRNFKQSRIHYYNTGSPLARQTLSGVVMPAYVFFEDKPSLPINDDLHTQSMTS